MKRFQHAYERTAPCSFEELPYLCSNVQSGAIKSGTFRNDEERDKRLEHVWACSIQSVSSELGLPTREIWE